MGYIYVSYSLPDQAVARRLVESLQERGYTVWVDFQDLLPGRNWSEQTQAAIQSSEVFVVLLSPESASSSLINREITVAGSASKPIIPILLREAALPPSLADRQYLTFTADWDNFIQLLVYALEASVEAARLRGVPPAPVPQPAVRSSAPPPRQERSAAIPAPPPAPPSYAAPGAPHAPLEDFIPAAPPAPVTAPAEPPAFGGASATQTMPRVAARQRRASRAPLLIVAGLFVVAVTALVLLLRLNGASNPRSVSSEPTMTTLARRTETAQANLVPSASFEFLPSPTDLANSGSSDTLQGTLVAMQVNATVAAFRATDESVLSPAEAAIIVNQATGGTNTLVFVVGILAALALGATGSLLFLVWSGTDFNRRRRTAHLTAHTATPTPETDPQPPEEPEKLLEEYQIFISSSDRDKEWVDILVEDLEALGYLVWWYVKDAPGLPFGNEIRSAIYHTKVFTIILSPDSMKSKHVEEEIRWAEIFNRPIVPVLHRHISVEERLYGLAKGADINFTENADYRSALELLTQAIEHYLRKRLEAPPAAGLHGQSPEMKPQVNS
jgi:hypothetical protein